MTILEVYILLGLIFTILLLLNIIVIRHLIKNNTLLSIDIYKEGVLQNETIRGAFFTKKQRKYIIFGEVLNQSTYFYTIRDFFKRKPLININYNEFKDKMIIVESIPIVGIKKTLNLILRDFKDKQRFVAWQPPNKLDKEGLINNVRIVTMHNLLVDLYEKTDTSTKADMIYKIAMPMALIGLALAMLIFFPKIYDTIMSNSTAMYTQATTGWQDIITKVKPLG